VASASLAKIAMQAQSFEASAMQPVSPHVTFAKGIASKIQLRNVVLYVPCANLVSSRFRKVLHQQIEYAKHAQAKRSWLAQTTVLNNAKLRPCAKKAN
jgi:membrane protein YqaA with SNARE-associated domain